MSSGLLASTRFRVQDCIACYPSLLRLSLAIRRGRQPPKLVCRDTDLLIEGYLRSANTFAVSAFRLANPHRRIAHHVHTRSHVLLALRRGTPALILLRQPEDAVRSSLVRQPETPPSVALRRYIAFYEGIAPHTDKLVLAQFDAVINDFSRVIKHVNQHFGTDFQGFGPRVGKAEVLAAIDKSNRSGHSGHINPRYLPRPHPDREQLKAKISLVGCERQIARAEVIFNRLSRQAIQPPPQAPNAESTK